LGLHVSLIHAIAYALQDLPRQGEDGAFIASRDGSDIIAQAVILATGVIENKPPVPHVADAVKDRLIRTCPICDGYECIGKQDAVLGSAEHAAREALFLRAYTENSQFCSWRRKQRRFQIELSGT
jgi:thioredoxin reductase (NADPH)